jgi:hypothetical protein
MFVKVELNVINMMEGQTLTDSSPAILDVGSSKRDTEQCPAEVEPRRSCSGNGLYGVERRVKHLFNLAFIIID